MPLFLYNSLTRKIEEFKPIADKKVGMYTCGPTVYDYDHIGHAWNYTMADILRRAMEFNGYSVKHVMNITDVGHLTSDGDTGEDKLEKGSRREGKTVWEVAKYYTDIFLRHRDELNMLRPAIICKATDHIPEMIALIRKIEEKGAAYTITDGVYFDISKFPDYGKLSGNTLEKLKAGARIEVNPEKKNPADFALWKFSPPPTGGPKRQMEWDSPWGRGFPGWHIECSAMSMKYLGETFDLHTGGEDNKFPHHECEIAQSETANGKTFVNHWFHTRFLMVDGQKMSKSLKNFHTLEDLAKKGFPPLALRYLFLTAHYRTNLNFTWQSLKAAQNALNKLYDAVNQYGAPHSAGCPEFERQFTEAINDDLNTPRAIAIIWDVIKSKYPDPSKKQTLLKMDKVLGLGLDKIKKNTSEIPAEIKKLADKRDQARKDNNWKLADELREKIEKAGFTLKDSPIGAKIKKK